MCLNTLKLKNPYSSEFWNEVDSLTLTERNSLIEKIGGSELLNKKYTCKKYNSTYRHQMGIELLEFDYACLVYSADIILSDIGKSGDKYCLSRINDEGSYKRGNCKFVTNSENISQVKQSTENILKFVAAGVNRLKELRQDKVWKDSVLEKIKTTKQSNIIYITRQEEKRRKLLEKPIHTENSQYGSYWITDGIIRKKWHDRKGSIPIGFYRRPTRYTSQDVKR